jgi:branched-chain amino acid aminotransferase
MARTQNGTVWVNGEIRPWDAAAVPLMSSAILRAMAVFDGMVAGYAHAQRLHDSARSMGIPMAYGVDDILEASARTAQAEMDSTGARFVYVRPMALGAELPGSVDGASLTIACFGQSEPTSSPSPIQMLTSPWRRPRSDAMPASVKAVANYQITRLARAQANDVGRDDAILLNDAGRVAEAAGAALLIERGGRIISPPVWEDCLPSITVDLLGRLAHRVGSTIDREPVPLANLHSATAVATAGTLADVVPVTAVDHASYAHGTLLPALRETYVRALIDGAPELHEWQAR